MNMRVRVDVICATFIHVPKGNTMQSCTSSEQPKLSSPRPDVETFYVYSLPFDHSFFDVMYGEVAVQPPAMSSFCWGEEIAKSPRVRREQKLELIDVPNYFENRALACCEWQKVVAFLHSESVAYLLGQR